MLIQIDDHALVDDLRAHYSRSGFTAELVGGGMIEVHAADGADPEGELRAVALHLRVWQIAHPETQTQLLP